MAKSKANKKSMRDRLKDKGAVEVNKLTTSMFNNIGTYIYGDKVIRVSKLADSKEEYMRMYYDDRKHRINYKRRQLYVARREAGLCPKCGRDKSDKSYVMCQYCRDMGKKNADKSS